ncbi:MAG: SRPBCC family protein [Bacteroidales bacterium]|nr:SRPBCC family protein [Bacteroidales bacterium]
MTTITSHKKTIAASAETIFEFLSDFNNLQDLMPNKVVNWNSTMTTCAFTIENMAHMNMAYGKNIKNEKIEMVSEGKNPFTYDLSTNISKIDESNSEVSVVFNGDMNAMIAMMAKKPLQNFVDVLVDRLQEKYS